MLTDTDKAMLDLEARWYPPSQLGAKEQRIRELFDIGPIRYWQRINALIDTTEALAYAPTTVNRLRRLRTDRARRRHAA